MVQSCLFRFFCSFLFCFMLLLLILSAFVANKDIYKIRELCRNCKWILMDSLDGDTTDTIHVANNL